MTDSLQRWLHDLLFALGAALLLVALLVRPRAGWRWWAVAAVSGVLAVVLAKLGGALVSDPRPYLAEHYQPLTHVAADNGFPSDHSLAASLATLLAWPLNRPLAVAFAVLTLLIMAARLAIGAHHTLDVAGSALIAALAVGLASAIPWPASWRRATARRA